MGSGKAENLARLAARDFRVPPFYVVTDAPVAHELPGEFFAVRSSAAGEDAAGLSFAGIHESLLFVRANEIAAAIETVRASAMSERAIAYRSQHGVALDDTPMPVIVQQMIDADVSGVVFTANPTTQDVQEIVISSLFGLGEGLVSQGFDADTFIVQKKLGFELAAEIAEKTEAIVRAPGGGTMRVRVGDPKARSLTDEQIRELARVSMGIESLFGKPQDIEFAFDASGLWILQARPITTIDEYGPAAGYHLIWDNSNIVESFFGVTSPMTFSVIRRAYTIVYRQFAKVMGIPDRVVDEQKFVFENMLGLFRGQVFYHLQHWYALVRLFPGYEQNRKFMESMMGVREGVEGGGRPARQAGQRPAPLAMLPLAFRMIHNFSRIDTLTKEFEANFKQHYDNWSRINLDSLKPWELMYLYLQFEEKVLWSWRAPIINDFFVMIFYGTLKKLSASWCRDENLQNDLLAGEGGIESAEPAKMLLRMAEVARPNAALREAIEAGDLERAREHPEFARDFDQYMELYGFRGMNELKLEEPPLRDRPDLVLTFIRNYLLAEAKPQRELEIRADAERRAFGALSPLRRMIFRFVLKRARIGVRNRENMRFARTRIFGLVREVVRAMGRRMTEEGILDSAGDVFYIGLDELWDYVKGTALTTDLRGLAALRRKEFDEYRANPDIDERFETWGMAYHRNRFRARAAASQAAADGTLKGIACSPGQVTGPVKVVHSPNDDLRLNGEILVAARTDPGWVPLYPSISGLLIERGSILSHSAIVAREMGIPTIVGIRGLTELVQSDDIVKMDGSTGVVELLKREQGETRAE